VRRVLAAVGVGAVAVGLAALVVGSLAGEGAVPAIDPGPALAVLGIVTLVAGLFVALDRSLTDGERVSTPDRERGVRVPVPGAACDPTGPDPSARLAFERRLEDRVVDALVAERNCTPEEARRQVEDGTWTDDALAAAVLASGAFDPPFLTGVRWRLRGIDPYERGAERAVDALARIREGAV